MTWTDLSKFQRVLGLYWKVLSRFKGSFSCQFVAVNWGVIFSLVLRFVLAAEETQMDPVLDMATKVSIVYFLQGRRDHTDKFLEVIFRKEMCWGHFCAISTYPPPAIDIGVSLPSQYLWSPTAQKHTGTSKGHCAKLNKS